MKTLNDLFTDELADLYDAERRIIVTSPKLTNTANGDELEKACQSHVTETESQATKLETV